MQGLANQNIFIPNFIPFDAVVHQVRLTYGNSVSSNMAY